VRNDKEKIMEEGGQVLASILTELKEAARPGAMTQQLDELAKRLCLKNRVKPSFLGYEGYPAAVCVSINDEVVHGIPNKRVIKEGDMISLDLGVYYKGYHTDAAITFPVGKVSKEAQKLMEVTEKALYFGIEEARAGHRIGDIGAEIQSYVEENGFNVVRALVGHGVGEKLHQDPLIPNYGQRGTGPLIKEGMTLAIEPMVSAGGYDVSLAGDNWTYRTSDGSLVAHFEHTVYISANGPVVLTSQM
jgi:methionyl aminopeptidase